MNIDTWYRDHFEHKLKGRYITMQHIYPLLDMYKSNYEISVPGLSELGVDLPLVKVGNGPKIVLGWSQMHGNESTTTKSLFDFLKFVNQKSTFQKEIESFLNNYSFYFFPILNPDGARRYTRENANGVDLNRDAAMRSQKESQCLRQVFDRLKPVLCLNLHDQRSIYGFGDGKPATVSFLAPAANPQRSVTEARHYAMAQIVKMNSYLQQFIPGQIGRYDDSFNEACVGDTFQKLGVPTILFEAGHYTQDYQREKTREFVFYALVSLFDLVPQSTKVNYRAYFNIPENLKNYNDILLRNVCLGEKAPCVSVAVQYEEVLEADKIKFIPRVDEIGSLKSRLGHLEVNFAGKEILKNVQEKLTVGSNVSEIFDKNDISLNFFQ